MCVLGKKVRLDTLIVEKGLVPSREKAKRIIMCGNVYIDNQKVDKCGIKIDEEKEIEIRGNPLPYVSRGGLKLEKALQVFNIDVSNKVSVDIGASTGGFTDCLLKNGAKKVYAVDVGYGQLAWELRNDERVVNMERINARYLTDAQIHDKADIVTIDVSFISLKLILPAAVNLMKPEGVIICLIKPQFEAGKEQVGKKGVVKDENIHIDVIEKVINYAWDLKLKTVGLSFSPIKGPEGNIEYLACMKKRNNEHEYINNISIETIKEVVKASHENQY